MITIYQVLRRLYLSLETESPREDCLEGCSKQWVSYRAIPESPPGFLKDILEAFRQEAVLEERERCACIAEKLAEDRPGRIADTIRDIP